MKKKLIIINGVMGIGKTTICKELYKKLENSFWLDGDSCWMMNPFIVNEENKKMVLDNITYILNNFLKNSSTKYVVFNWVIPTDDVMNDVLGRIDVADISIYKITLMSSKDELVKRIGKDIKLGLRDKGNIKRSLERFDLYHNMNTQKLDTSKKTVENIVKEIIDIINISA
ncbi:Tunicamycin resistance protein [Clostridium neonatale]|uniref:AAA family ATPase n=1 Tax=Clostridium neonatale TaxID=137838 RepID=UPI00291BD0D1|nr:AAA family ATPase [Clostridium neonatale]CAI3716591.1 Tunicamycin resistance protein [Clostridium neonatale]